MIVENERDDIIYDQSYDFHGELAESASGVASQEHSSCISHKLCMIATSMIGLKPI
jgi:hypothetical protein